MVKTRLHMRYCLVLAACLSSCTAPATRPARQAGHPATTARQNSENLAAEVEDQKITLAYFEDSHVILKSTAQSDTFDLATDADHPLQSSILDDAGRSIGRLLVHELLDENPNTRIEIWIDCGASVPAPLCDRTISFK